MRDMINNKQITHLGNLAISGVTPIASNILDVDTFDAANLDVTVNTITDAGTAAGFTAHMQHSDTLVAVDFENVPAVQTQNATRTVVVVADNVDNSIAGGCGYAGSKRYLRFNIIGTTGSDADVSIRGTLNVPHRAPTNLIGVALTAT